MASLASSSTESGEMCTGGSSGYTRDPPSRVGVGSLMVPSMLPYPRRCHCDQNLKVQTAWTKNNPGRRFVACPIPKDGCGFFKWLDPTFPFQARDVIGELLETRSSLLGYRDELAKKLCYSTAELEKLREQQKDMLMKQQNDLKVTVAENQMLKKTLKLYNTISVVGVVLIAFLVWVLK